MNGNITAILQVRTTSKNAIGESIKKWIDVMIFTGFLDLSGGDSKYSTFDAKIQESTHVFICDYKPIPATLEVNDKVVKVSAESCRMVTNSKYYDVMLIDNPMELNKHLEIYLKYTGVQ